MPVDFVPEELCLSLQSFLPTTDNPREFLKLEDISTDLAGSRVLRLIIINPSNNATESYILKVPDWGGPSPVQPSDPMVPKRERLFLESWLFPLIPQGLHIPKVLGIDRCHNQTWIWMEDVEKYVNITWNFEQANLAAKRLALLTDLYIAKDKELSDLTWLGREEYTTYATHIPTAHTNLNALANSATWSDLFTQEEIALLHRCLDLYNWAVQEMKKLPLTLIHGDFHIRNLGFTDDNSMIMLDWAHIGIAPIGCDLATFTSVYELFGGNVQEPETSLENQLITTYVNEIERLSGRSGLQSSVAQACGLWHLTWGLHLRLGPGLTALLQELIADPKRRHDSAVDVQKGSLRAIDFVVNSGGLAYSH